MALKNFQGPLNETFLLPAIRRSTITPLATRIRDKQVAEQRVAIVPSLLLRKSAGPEALRASWPSSLGRFPMQPGQERLDRRALRMPWRIDGEMRLDANGVLDAEDRTQLSLGHVAARDRRAFERDAQSLH